MLPRPLLARGVRGAQIRIQLRAMSTPSTTPSSFSSDATRDCEADPRSAQCLLWSSSPSPTTPPSNYHPRFSSSDVMQQSAGPGSALRALQSAMKLSEPTSTRTNPLPPHSRARAVRYQINTTPEKMHASATSNAVRVFPDDLASQSKDRGQLAPGYQSVLISWLESSAFAFSGVRRRWQSPCAPGNLLCACFGDWHSRDMQSFC